MGQPGHSPSPGRDAPLRRGQGAWGVFRRKEQRGGGQAEGPPGMAGEESGGGHGDTEEHQLGMPDSEMEVATGAEGP